jgi:MFS family permease
MLATILLDPPLLFAFGGVFASADRTGRRAYRVALLYALWFAIVVAPFFWLARDWMCVYLFDATGIPPWILAIAFAAVLAAAAAAGVAASRAGAASAGHAGTHRRRRALTVAGVGLILWIAATVLTWNAYQHVGTRSEYMSGRARLTAHDPTFHRAFAFAAPALALPFIASLAYLRRGRAERTAR